MIQQKEWFRLTSKSNYSKRLIGNNWYNKYSAKLACQINFDFRHQLCLLLDFKFTLNLFCILSQFEWKSSYFFKLKLKSNAQYTWVI